MSRWIDQVSFGPARRKRRMLRRLRALDREYAAACAGPSRAWRSSVDLRGWLAFAVALTAVGLLVTIDPGLLPAPVRDAAGMGPKRLAAVRRITGSGSYAFTAHQPGDPTAPVAYDPCRPVEVRINPAGGPPDAVQLVRSAIAEVASATGLELRYDGLTRERPHWHSAFVPTFLGRPRARPVLVTWATDAEVPELSGNVAGIGGSVAVTGADDVVRYLTGGATLDSDAFAQLGQRADGNSEMRAIVLHELGHVVGLAHVQDERELMNGDNVGLLDFGTGDRVGLAKLGSGTCG